MPATVIVLAGPSGAGKSRLAARLGLPVLRMDDFYRSGEDPALPSIRSGPNAGTTDWDHPDSWLADEAAATLRSLCTDGSAEVPLYDLASNGRYGARTLALDSAPFLVAEGIFAHRVVPMLAEAGLLAAAYCVTQHPPVTFARRLVRDLRERRKPPLLLVRRGVSLLRSQRAVVAEAVQHGCRVVAPETAYAEVTGMVARSGWVSPRPPRTPGRRPR